MLSKYCKFIKLGNGKTAIFHSLHPDPIFTDNDMETSLTAQLGCNDRILREKGLLVSKDHEDEHILREYMAANDSTDKIIEVLYLLITFDCNYACTYCHSGSQYCDTFDSQKTMASKVAEKAISLFYEYLKKLGRTKGTVVFYGGEPLLKADLLSKIFEYAKKLDSVEIIFSLITNAALVDKGILSLLQNNNIEVSVSLDGPHMQNNKNRISRDGRNAYDLSMTGLRMIADKGLRVGASITLTRSVIDAQEKVVDWIKSQPFTGINYNLLHSKNMTCNEKKQHYIESAQFSCKSFEDLHGFRRPESKMTRRIGSYKRHDFIFSDCAAVGANQLTVFPDGDITICHVGNTKAKGKIQDINELEKFVQQSDFSNWTNASPINQKGCRDCYAISICGGGCINSSFSQNSISSNFIDLAYCEYIKRIFLWMLTKDSEGLLPDDIYK